MRRALALILLVLPLAACGGSKSSAPPFVLAASKSSAAASVKVDMTMTTSSALLPEPLSMTASGAEDNASHRGDLTVDMSKFASSLGAKTLNPAEWKGTELLDTANGHVVIYMKIPFLSKAIPGGKPWIRFDLTTVGKKLGVDFSQLTQLTSNPAQMIDWLRATSGTITKVGTETVDGVQTTHYHATIDLSKYPDLVPPDQRAEVRKSVDALEKLSGLHTYPVDAWVGSDSYIRKMHIALTESVGGQKLGIDLTMHFHDFGAPVSIALPPADQTVDLSRLTGGNTP